MTDPASLGDPGCSDKLYAGRVASPMRTCAALVICRAVNLSLERGNSDASCCLMSSLGAIAGARFGDYRGRISLRQLGIELVERRGLARASGQDLSELR